MHSEVSNFACGILHAQRYAQDILNEEHYERRPNNVPANDEKCGYDLDPDLTTFTINGTPWISETKGCATGGSRKEASSNTTNECTNEMGVKDVEAVVDMLEEPHVSLAKIQKNLRKHQQT